MNDIINILENSWAITLDNVILPGIGCLPECAITQCYETKSDAQAVINTQLSGEQFKDSSLMIIKIGNPMDFMIKAARNGLGGIAIIRDDVTFNYQFMTRIEEAASDIPSVLAAFSDVDTVFLHDLVKENLPREVYPLGNVLTY